MLQWLIEKRWELEFVSASWLSGLKAHLNLTTSEVWMIHKLLKNKTCNHQNTLHPTGTSKHFHWWAAKCELDGGWFSCSASILELNGALQYVFEKHIWWENKEWTGSWAIRTFFSICFHNIGTTSVHFWDEMCFWKQAVCEQHHDF